MPVSFNIPAIRESLLRVKQDFHLINQNLSDQRDPLTDEVVSHMVDGYRALNGFFADGTNPFELGQSVCMLELNQIVLCGFNSDTECNVLSLRDQFRQINMGTFNERLPIKCKTNSEHMMAASQYFYGDDGCIREVMEWFEINDKKSVWLRAAGLHGQILSQPQLFTEGNHRTTTLLMSYLLASQGKPPFVLTPENAANFFEHSSVIKKIRKQGFDAFLSLPQLAEKFADQLEANSDEAFLL